MNSKSLNRYSIWLGGVGTGLLVYGIVGKNLRFNRTVTIVAGVIALVTSGIILFVTRRRSI